VLDIDIGVKTLFCRYIVNAQRNMKVVSEHFWPRLMNMFLFTFPAWLMYYMNTWCRWICVPFSWVASTEVVIIAFCFQLCILLLHIYCSYIALIISSHIYHIFKALNSLICVDVPLSNYSLTHSGLSKRSGRPTESLHCFFDIFDNIDNKNIIDFINDAHFYHQLWAVVFVFCISLIALVLHLIFIIC